MTATTDDLRNAVDAALSKAGVLTNGWVLVAEQVDEEGDRYLVHETSEDMAAWTRTGMLYAAVDMGQYMDPEPEVEE